MPFQRPLSVFVSYSHLDEDARARLDAHLTSLRHEGAISQWHDRIITAGTEWEGAIDTHLKTADIVLLLVSPNFMSSTYCIGVEATEAIRRHLAGEARVIPIIVGHVDWRRMPIGAMKAGLAEGPSRSGTSLGMLNALPRDGKPVTDLREWGSADAAYLNVAEGLRRVVNELAPEIGVAPGAPPLIVTGTAATVPVPTAPRINSRTDAAVTLLSKLMRLDNITYVLGSRFAGADEQQSPGPAEIARHLLGDRGMHLIDGSWDKLLPSPDSIGSYYAIGYGAALLEDEVLSFMSQRSSAVPKVHTLLAQLLLHNEQHASKLALTQLRPSERKPQVIVSTNIDLMMERALFIAGVPFTRIVQHLTEPKLTITEVRELRVIPAEDHPNSPHRIKVMLEPGDDGVRQEREYDTGDLAQVDAALDAFPRREVTPRAASQVEGMGNQNPLESFPIKRLRAPILYKLRGSQDVRLSCALSTEQYLEFVLRMAGRFVPTQIREVVAQTPVVFLGCGFLDPEFRLVYHTFEDALIERQTNVYPIYSVQRHPSLEPNDNYRKMELDIWEQLKELGPRRARITTLEDTPESFLGKMEAPLNPGRRDVA